jgi:phosphoribosylformylglycinamidine cyclo-ligase
MQKHGPIDDREAYGNFNMGAGFALFVPQKDVDKVNQIGIGQPFRMLEAGYVEKSDDKKVVIQPKNLVYEGETLSIR